MKLRSWTCALLLAWSSAAYQPRNASAVLDLAETVTAGKNTMVHLNISNSNNAKFDHQYMEIFAWAYTREETKDDPTSGDPALYCLLEQCVATNLSTFAINIPTNILPPTRMLLGYSLFGSSKVKFSASGEQHTAFNLTADNKTTLLSDWERRQGWGAVGHWSSRLPCRSVPCARTCLKDYLDPEQPYYKQSGKKDFKACVAACDGIREDSDPRTCIVENVTDSTLDDARGEASVTISWPSETGDVEGKAAREADASRLVGTPLGLSLAALALLSLF